MILNPFILLNQNTLPKFILHIYFNYSYNKIIISSFSINSFFSYSLSSLKLAKFSSILSSNTLYRVLLNLLNFKESYTEVIYKFT